MSSESAELVLAYKSELLYLAQVGLSLQDIMEHPPAYLIATTPLTMEVVAKLQNMLSVMQSLSPHGTESLLKEVNSTVLTLRALIAHEPSLMRELSESPTWFLTES